MRRAPARFSIRSSLLLLALAAAAGAPASGAFGLAAPVAAQELRPFTVDDALAVRGVSVADATKDARWIAARVTTARSRMGTDHFRFGDPTYVAPSTNELLVLDAETGEYRPVFNGEVQTGSEAWSQDGRLLGFLRHVDGATRLEVYDREANRVRDVRLRPGRELVWGGPLAWLPDGSGVVVAVRAAGWSQEARSAYEALEHGPIVVQDSRDDFLSWDAVRMKGSLGELALVSIPGGQVRILAPEGPYQDVRVSEDGSHLTWTVATPVKTSYTRSAGTEYEIFRLELAPGAEPVSLVEKSERRVRPQFSPDGTRFAWADRGDVWMRAMDASGPVGDSAVKVTEGERTALTEADTTKRSYSLDRWSPDGSALLLRAQDGFWTLDAGEAGVEGAQAAKVWGFDGETPEAWEEAPALSVVAWTENGYLYATRSARDRWERGIARMNLATGREEILSADADLYRDWQIADDGSRLVFRRSDGDRPDELWTADGDLAGARALTDLNPQLEGVRLSRSELVTYLDVDGNQLRGVLHYPAEYVEGERYPLVAEIYEDFFDNGYNYSAQILAAQGWFVLRPSVELEIGFPGEAWMKGVTTAINHLMDQGLVDGGRLGVHGTSYGGYATNLLITQTDRFKAAINISGKVN
ncbi:MAG TPA: prolyl oligopeptidase family serine peptidase, partial [Longimicrobiales bacterium]|nr:prolyl oligopeptidase family serine peptidase [Longimicrobiales bacterium]